MSRAAQEPTFPNPWIIVRQPLREKPVSRAQFSMVITTPAPVALSRPGQPPSPIGFPVTTCVLRRRCWGGTIVRYVSRIQAITCGFVFMSLDEQFQGHEQIRDELLRPHGFMTDVSFLIPGDIVLISYVIVGAICSLFILSELKGYPLSLKLFVAAVALIGFSAVQDALDLEFMHNKTVRHIQTVVEELAEIWAQLLFALAFLNILSHKLHWLLDRDELSND